LLLPKKYQKEALCEAHNSIFGGHDVNLKTYIKISSSYYWPGLFKDVKMHVQTCLTCQQRKRTTIKPTPLQPLPIPERPNWRIHANLFGPMLTAIKNLFYASPMLSQNMLQSHRSRIRMLKQSRTLFSKNGFANLEYRPRFTRTVARSS
jgi:hypothetical protein